MPEGERGIVELVDGRLVHGMGVGRDVESIFAFRRRRMAEIFGGDGGDGNIELEMLN